MRIGRARHRLHIQVATTTVDAAGGATRTWATAATRWGYVEPTTGRETYLDEQSRAIATHKVGIRYYDGLTPAMRFEWQGRIFNIVEARDLREIHRDTECICQEVVTGAEVEGGGTASGTGTGTGA
ncbi:MAG: phage head closure protein [Candidatus Atribacteria bacterium]|nr:phage head closure protein [Candidatus Atribacteria bacterium]